MVIKVRTLVLKYDILIYFKAIGRVSLSGRACSLLYLNIDQNIGRGRI